MKDLRFPHWMFAGLIALLLHGGLLAAIPKDRSSGAVSTGSGGVEMSFGPAGGAAGGTPVAPSPVEEQKPTEVETAEPPAETVQEVVEPVVDPPLDPVQEAVVEPVPEPAVVEQVAEVTEPVAEPVERVSEVTPPPVVEAVPEKVIAQTPPPKPKGLRVRRAVDSPLHQGRHSQPRLADGLARSRIISPDCWPGLKSTRNIRHVNGVCVNRGWSGLLSPFTATARFPVRRLHNAPAIPDWTGRP